MNNKGFAITTLIYGLAIMMLLLIAIIMATLTSMRKNIKDLSSQIEEELLTLSNGNAEYTFSSDADTDHYSVPRGGAGYYRIEVWEKPKVFPADKIVDFGNYKSGIINLSEGDNLTINNKLYSAFPPSQDTLIIPNINQKFQFGKVTIRKLTSSIDNKKSWKGSTGFKVSITGDYKGDCKISYTKNKTTSDISITGFNTQINDTNFDDIRLLCENDYSNLNFKIDLLGLNKNIYNGKYKNNNGRGVYLSQYQPNATTDILDHGNYYIFASDNNKYVVTVNGDGKSVGMDLLGAKDTQKWAIDKVCNYDLNEHKCVNSNPNGTSIEKVYRIIELTSYNALDIELDENIEGNRITAQYNYNSLSINEPQLWRIKANKDGTYSFKTVVDSSDKDINMGYISYDSNLLTSNTYNDSYELKLSKRNDKVDFENQKFNLFLYD